MKRHVNTLSKEEVYKIIEGLDFRNSLHVPCIRSTIEFDCLFVSCKDCL